MNEYITTQEVLEAIDSAKRQGMIPLVLVIPVHPKIANKKNGSGESLFQAIKENTLTFIKVWGMD